MTGLPAGSYRYLPSTHSLILAVPGDLHSALAAAALHQAGITRAPAAIVIAAVQARTEWKYGERAARYVHTEAGHAGQNLLLQAVALGLGGTPVGAFDDQAVHRVLGLRTEEQPLMMLPVGYPP